MKVYANKAETRFFKTDDHLKNLHAIEMNSVKGLIKDYGFCTHRALLCGNALVVTDFDEIKEVNLYDKRAVRDLSIEGLSTDHDSRIEFFRKNSIYIDLIQKMEIIDIAHEVALLYKDSYREMDDYMDDIKSQVWNDFSSEYRADDLETIVINKRLTIAINHDTETVNNLELN